MSLPLAARALLLSALLFSSIPCTAQPMTSTHAAAIDLPRFMGAWHVIAHVPCFSERGHVASREEYSLQPDGKIGVRHVYQHGFGEPIKTLESTAAIKPGTGNRRWATRRFGVIPTRFRILEVASDYSWALIDYPGHDLAWVLARTPDMDDALYAELFTRMGGHGVAAHTLARVPQLEEQVGKPGFAAPKKP